MAFSGGACADPHARSSLSSDAPAILATVRRGYTAQTCDELTLAQGSAVKILTRGSSFCLVHSASLSPASAGWFPTALLALDPADTSDASEAQMGQAQPAVAAGDPIELTPEDFPRIADGQVLRVQYAYQQTAADEISLRPGQHVLAIEHSEDGWLLGIVNPGSWLADLESKSLLLHVGADIGWLPANHTAPTDLHMAKLLRACSQPSLEQRIAAAMAKLPAAGEVASGSSTNLVGPSTQTGSPPAANAATAASTQHTNPAEPELSDAELLSAAWRQASQRKSTRYATEVTSVAHAAVLSSIPNMYDNIGYNGNMSAPLPPDKGQHGSTSVLSSLTRAMERDTSMPYSDAELRLRNTVIALYDCKAEAPDELEFDRGDVIVLTRRDPAADWWEGHLHGEMNADVNVKLVPRSYVRDLDMHEFQFMRSMLPKPEAPPTPAGRAQHLYEDIRNYAAEQEKKEAAQALAGGTAKASAGSKRGKPSRPAPPPPPRKQGANDAKQITELPPTAPQRTYSIGRRPGGTGRGRKNMVAQAGKLQQAALDPSPASTAQSQPTQGPASSPKADSSAATLTSKPPSKSALQSPSASNSDSDLTAKSAAVPVAAQAGQRIKAQSRLLPWRRKKSKASTLTGEGLDAAAMLAANPGSKTLMRWNRNKNAKSNDTPVTPEPPAHSAAGKRESDASLGSNREADPSATYSKPNKKRDRRPGPPPPTPPRKSLDDAPGLVHCSSRPSVESTGSTSGLALPTGASAKANARSVRSRPAPGPPVAAAAARRADAETKPATASSKLSVQTPATGTKSRGPAPGRPPLPASRSSDSLLPTSPSSPPPPPPIPQRPSSESMYKLKLDNLATELPPPATPAAPLTPLARQSADAIQLLLREETEAENESWAGVSHQAFFPPDPPSPSPKVKGRVEAEAIDVADLVASLLSTDDPVAPQDHASVTRRASVSANIAPLNTRTASGIIRGLPSLPNNTVPSSPRISSRRGAPLPGLVVKSFEASQPDELTLVEGEMVIISQHHEEEAWWVGRVGKDREGRFPQACVRLQPRGAKGGSDSGPEADSAATADAEGDTVQDGGDSHQKRPLQRRHSRQVASAPRAGTVTAL